MPSTIPADPEGRVALGEFLDGLEAYLRQLQRDLRAEERRLEGEASSALRRQRLHVIEGNDG